MDLIKIDPFQNVGNTALATSRYRPIAPSSLYGIALVMGGTFTEANIAGIRVKAPGGKDLVPNITGARLRDLYEYEGLTHDTGFFPIFFGDPTARTMRGKHIGNFDNTVYPGDMAIEVNISGATNPTLSAYAMVMPPKLAMGLDYSAAEAALSKAWKEAVISISAAVTLQAITPSIPVGALLKKLALFHTNVTVLDVKREGFSIYEEVPAALTSWLQDDVYVRAPQSGLMVYDRIVDGEYSEAARTVRADGSPANLQFRVTTSGSDTVTAYSDILAPLPIL